MFLYVHCPILRASTCVLKWGMAPMFHAAIVRHLRSCRGRRRPVVYHKPHTRYIPQTRSRTRMAIMGSTVFMPMEGFLSVSILRWVLLRPLGVLQCWKRLACTKFCFSVLDDAPCSDVGDDLCARHCVTQFYMTPGVPMLKMVCNTRLLS